VWQNYFDMMASHKLDLLEVNREVPLNM